LTLNVATERSVVDSAGLVANETWLEPYFKAMETPGADRDDASVRERVGLLLRKCCNRFELCVAIQTSVAPIVLDIPSNLPLCGGREGVPSLSEVHQVLCKVTASQKDGVMQSVSFVDEHCCVRHAVTSVHHTVRHAYQSEQKQDSLDSHARGVHAERLEHDLGRALSVLLGGSEELP